MQLTYFPEAELACGCGECGFGQDHISNEALYRLDHARQIAGVPFVVHPDKGGSAVRCATHNTAVGGSETSSHVPRANQQATAFDIYAPNSNTRFLIVDGLIRAGFRRIGIHQTFIHADCDPAKDAAVLWLY